MTKLWVKNRPRKKYKMQLISPAEDWWNYREKNW